MTTATSLLSVLDLENLQKTELNNEPYEYLIAGNTVRADQVKGLMHDFPRIDHIGSYPLSKVSYGPVFQKLVDDLFSHEFERAVSRKFDLNLSQYTKMITVRGRCSNTSDGHIHTDSKDKIITVLLYLNEEWTAPGGRLRVLRSQNLEDSADEVVPVMGNMLLFRRCDYSWHGHHPCEGKRLSLQMNWVKNARYQKVQEFRHNVSSFIKKLTGRKPTDDGYYG